MCGIYPIYLLNVVSAFYAVLLEKILYLAVRIYDLAYGNIVVERCDEVSYILGNIYFMEPRFCKQFRAAVCKVGTKDMIYDALFYSLIEFINAVCEYRICSVTDNTSCIALFKLACNIKHGFAGGNDIICNEYILACNGVT